MPPSGSRVDRFPSGGASHGKPALLPSHGITGRPDGERGMARGTRGVTVRLPAEIDLLAACCRWPPSDTRREATQAAAATVDWDRFDRVVTRHRVAGLVADGLRRADIAVPPAIAARAATAARQALNMARETVRLQRAFDSAGISVMFVKGATLAMLAYRDLSVKQSWDIDLLVDPEDAAAGRCLLEKLDYRLVHPELDHEQFSRFLSYGKECAFISEDRGIAVELHWRLISNPRLLPGISSAPQFQDVSLGGQPVRTLADDPLFAYLCAHGTIHGWARLKWIADVNALLANRSPEEIERLYQSAVQLGAGRTPGVALLLCHRLFALSLEPSLFRSLSADRRTEQLVETGLRCIAHGDGAEEIGRYSPMGLRMTGSHFWLVPGRSYAWSQVREKWFSSHDRVYTRLPAPVGFLYHLIRIPSFLARLYRRSRARVRT